MRIREYLRRYCHVRLTDFQCYVKNSQVVIAAWHYYCNPYQNLNDDIMRII